MTNHLLTRAAGAIALATLPFVDLARGQAGPGLKYEEASIRPANPDDRITRIEVRYTGSFQGTRVSLRDMILYAYNVRDYQVSGGPPWAASERYDVRTIPDEPDPAPSWSAPSRAVEPEARGSLRRFVGV